MTGFIKGLFERKGADEAQSESSGAFFLDADSAKTFGDIDYMRTPKAVKKRFRMLGGEGEIEVVEEISGMEKREVGAETTRTGEEKSTAAPPSPSLGSAADRRRVDTSMDMFRNMAKDIKR